MIGDMAQYYHILNYQEHSPVLISTLVTVLPPDSRIVRHFMHNRLSLDQTMLAVVIDCLQILVWQNTKNGHKGLKRPASFLKALTEDSKREEVEEFDSPDDYLAWREKKGFKNG